MKRPILNKDMETELLSRLDVGIHEAARVGEIAHEASAIYDAYSEEFSAKTGLTKKDWGFLFTATALQMLRQYLLTSFPERLDDQKAAEKVEGRERIKEEKEYRKDNPGRCSTSFRRSMSYRIGFRLEGFSMTRSSSRRSSQCRAVISTNTSPGRQENKADLLLRE